MKTFKPVISIVIPTYEQEGVGGSHLAHLFSSIINQTFPEFFEVVISDNSDGLIIYNIVQMFTPSFKERNIEVQYHKNPVKGISFNTNNAIKFAQADLIKIMYQDDFFSGPESLSKFYQALQDNNKQWVMSDSVYQDDDRELITQFKAKYNGVLTKGINSIGMPSVIAFKKTDICFDPAIKTLLDVDFYLQMGERYGEPVHIEEPLIVQRIHKLSASNTMNNYRQTDIQLIRKKLRDTALLPEGRYQVPPTLKNYKNLMENPSDINEHFPLLKEIASQCEHVTELGTREFISTYALIEGTPKYLHCYDINKSNNAQHAFKTAELMGVELKYFIRNVLDCEIKETDFLFIDTLHDREQLKNELRLHADKARKFIGFHDVTTYGLLNEHDTMTTEIQGILPAILEFLTQHSEWQVYRYNHFNNGMLILKKS